MAVIYSRTGFTPTFGGVLGTDAYYINVTSSSGGSSIVSAGVGAQAQIQYQRQVRPLFDLFSTNTFLALSRPYGTVAIGAFVGKAGSIHPLFGGTQCSVDITLSSANPGGCNGPPAGTSIICRGCVGTAASFQISSNDFLLLANAQFTFAILDVSP
jgi:hypothetical protein